MDAKPSARHPLTVIRQERGWSLNAVAEIVARRSGLNMATRREKVYRWENGVVPELTAQYALAEELGLDRQTGHDRDGPEWLLLASDGPAEATSVVAPPPSGDDVEPIGVMLIRLR